MDVTDMCSICNQQLHTQTDDVITVRKIGLETLIKKSKILDDDKWKQWDNLPLLAVHNSCRKRYAWTSTKTMNYSRSPIPSTSCGGTSSRLTEFAATENEFDFRELCLICAQPWDRKHKRGNIVQHEYMKASLLEKAKRQNDLLGMNLTRRLGGIESLVSVGARYHLQCYKNLSRNDLKSKNKTKQSEIESAFELVTNHIEASKLGKFTLTDLRNVMGSMCLTTKVLYRKLTEKYTNDIYILQRRGSETIIFYKCFSTSKLCGDWFQDPKSLDQKQKQTIVDVAAELIRTEIENYYWEVDVYNPADKFLSNVHDDIPPLLRGFLDKLIVNKSYGNDKRWKCKRDAVAHSILSVTRSTSFTSSLQLAVGLYIYRKSGSKLIINLLHKLGYCCSYYHLQQYETSVILDPPRCIIGDDVQVQYVFDNTDHNVSTLDGHRTYHCMGGIAIYTPHYKVNYVGITKISKSYSNLTASGVPSYRAVQNVPFDATSDGLDNIKFVDTDKLLIGQSSELRQPYLTYLWAKHCGVKNIPSWKRFMEILSAANIYNVSKVICLPFINEPPSNLTTINTALHTALEGTRQIGRKTCFVTFDQPLYYKARKIVEASEGALKDVIIRLGGFHLLMSYFGAVGQIMTGSGLEDVWTVSYTPQSVKKMISGQAYARALRAHILTFTAIGITICREFENEKRKEYDAFISSFLDKWNTEPPTLGACQAESTINEMGNNFVAQLHDLQNRGPTAQLWIQYFKIIVLALEFIEAELLGNWKLHLQSIRKMLPIFHAAGHFAYAKSAQIYLQDMVNLESTMNNDEYKKFTEEGFFTARRPDKPWSGIWTDMTIEQTLNRFFGMELKYGRGVQPSVITKYLSTMPSTFLIMSSLEEFCDISSSSSEQHIDLSNHRLTRDNDDINKFLLWFDEHGLFLPRTSLMSLSTGIIGGVSADCHLALEKGRKAMARMVGQSVGKITMSGTYKVQTLGAAELEFSVDNNQLHSVDISLLFQRISVVFRDNEQQTRNAFKYELSPFPLSLFDKFGCMRKTSKSDLYKIFKPCSIKMDDILCTMSFVIDGAFLLHEVCWPHGRIFGDICEVYRYHIVTHYGENAVVVFDGYSNENYSIKSYSRYRRREKNMTPDIEFTEGTPVTLSRTQFLSNVKNKLKFVKMLSRYLQVFDIAVKIATEDADTTIVETAIENCQCRGNNVAIVGSDTKLFVLLVALADANFPPMYFYKITSSAKKNVLYRTQDHLDLKPFILFAHAFFGCDTTSAFYDKSKMTLISILKKNMELQASINIFYEPESTIDRLSTCADHLIARLYNFSPNQTISEARYERFPSSVVHKEVEVYLAQLPPTCEVLCEHTKRTYYQIQSWLGNVLNPEDWGWTRTDSMLIPVMNPKNPAPEDLLKLVICGCTKNCKNSKCSCKQAGLPCTRFCRYCNGESCSNAAVTANACVTSEVHDSNENDDNLNTSNFISIVTQSNSEDGSSDKNYDSDEDDIDESMEIDMEY